MPYEVGGMSESDKQEFLQSCKNEPSKSSSVAEQQPPWYLYYYKKVNQYVLISKYHENGTVGILVTEYYNPHIDFEREVFGVNPKDLLICELPEHLSHLKSYLH